MLFRSLRSGRAVAFILVSAGCANFSPAPKTPAVLIAPDLETRLAVRQVVTDALHATVQLADDAFTNSPWVSIDRPYLRDASGLPIDGRRQSTPATFMLYKQGTRCGLIDLRTHESYSLRKTTCVSVRNAI